MAEAAPAARSADDDLCIALCMGLPPPFNGLCMAACIGSDADLVPQEEGHEASATISVPMDYPCTPETVVVAPSQSCWSGGLEAISAVSGCDGADTTVNGEDLQWKFGMDPNTICSELWFEAPEELTDQWPTAVWDFDAPEFAWVYMRVGYNEFEEVERCEPSRTPEGVAGDGSPRTFAVAALRPFAAFELVSTDTGVAGSDQTSATVRVFVGLMNHFSFFYPGDEGDGPWTTADLPVEMWDETTGTMTGRGTLANWWLTLTKSTSTSIEWTDPVDGPSRHSAVYPCEPGDHPAWSEYGGSYEGAENDSSPGLPASPLCFSNPMSADLGASTMYSLLGNVIWGEACVTVDSSDYTEVGAARAAFALLFGERVFIEHSVEFYGLPGWNYENHGAAHAVSRRFCVRLRDLRPVEGMRRMMAAFRGSFEGTWLFRDFDTAQLVVAAAQPPASGACAC